MIRWRTAASETGHPELYPHVLATHSTPLNREPEKKLEKAEQALQEGKEKNVQLAASKSNGVIIPPNGYFSYHARVGIPMRLRGFRYGLELQNGRLSKGIGGGCCSLSNMLYLIALKSGLDITERHRHGLDLFPDHQRAIPFACGATVFYPYADLKFSNPFDFPILVETVIENNQLIGRIRAMIDPDFYFEIEERDHHFHFDDSEDVWHRENRIYRLKKNKSDSALLEENLIAHNIGRCLYNPETTD